MEMVQQVCAEMDIYLLNSINPFRIEGQKTIAFEMLQQRGWEPPDWIVLPAGNLGNTAAIGKALLQARDLELIDRVPRIAAVQASGANPFYRSYRGGFAKRFTVEAHTMASAIKIGAPISYARAKRVIQETGGLVTEVDDAEILEAKAVIDRAGIGCEPASAASVAGARKLLELGAIDKSESVVCILTGNILKDPDTTISYHMDDTGEAKGYVNRPEMVGSELDDVRRTVESYL
jgi:threonine synthase